MVRFESVPYVESMRSLIVVITPNLEPGKTVAETGDAFRLVQASEVKEELKRVG